MVQCVIESSGLPQEFLQGNTRAGEAEQGKWKRSPGGHAKEIPYFENHHSHTPDDGTEGQLLVVELSLAFMTSYPFVEKQPSNANVRGFRLQVSSKSNCCSLCT